ncbi:predicted protein [Chaetoceros tenuissimus]|uniref:SPX domain-containing protein n=1 Tax=Chaetoceros tenuissimus TaxID=426638 RepID=A0AAD3HAV5_9STRA|nr:predicted protein [Chaetoceros tenuissimus]
MMLSRNTVALLLSASLPVVHIQAFSSTAGRRTSHFMNPLFYKDVNKDDEIYTFPNNLDLPEMSHDWKPEMPSYPQGISPFDGFEESLGQESSQLEHDISSPLSEGEQDGLDQHLIATPALETSTKTIRSKTKMYKRGGSSLNVQKHKRPQLKTDEASRHLSSNVSWLPATLATSQGNSVMEHVQTKPVVLASSPKISSKSTTPDQSDEDSLRQSPIKRFCIKHFSSISDSYEEFNKKVFNYGEVSQFGAKLDYMVSQQKIALLQMAISDSYEEFNKKVLNYGEVSQFASKLEYMVSQRKIALLQIASILNKTVRRWKRIANKELRHTIARIYALISNMDLASYRLPRLKTSLFRKSIKKQDNAFIAAIPTASASSKYLSSLRVSIATSTLEKPTLATIRYLDVLSNNIHFDEVAF